MDAEDLKLKIKTKAKEDNVEPQDLMQMYFFERLLYRISISKYKHNFILKGGLLLSALFENERRTTQDMDTMIKGISLDKDNIIKILNEIINTKVDDDITFVISKSEDIRLNDKYGGLRIKLIGKKEHLIVPLFIDITSGDPITPRELEFDYKCMFEDQKISIMAFNKETITAEKFETFIADNIINTRAKDFYDLYMLVHNSVDSLNNETLIKAIKNTFKRREHILDINNIKETFDLIKNNDKLMQNYLNFQKKKLYSQNVSYDEIMNEINKIVLLLEKTEKSR